MIELKNKEKDRDIYILANAPNIKEEDLSLLKNSITIGMNANPLLEEEYGFVSQYYVVSDMRFIQHPQKRILATKKLNSSTIRILRKELEKVDDKSILNKTYYVDAIGKNGFSFNLEKGFYFGSTTTMLAIQLATYLGAKNIYILGVDLRYSKDQPRFYKEKEVQEFDSFTGVQITNIRNAFLELQEKNINLINCSKNSLIYPYLPYKKLEETINENCRNN